MAKRKPGLHKEVTSIFGGVPLADKKAAAQRPAPTAPNSTRDKTPSVPGIDQKPPKQIPTTKPQQTIQQTLQTPRPEKPRVAPPAASTAASTWRQMLDRITKKLSTPKPGISNARQKTMVLFVPVLFIVLIVVLVRVITPPVRGTQSVDTKTLPSGNPEARTKIEWKIPEPYPVTLRDPMKVVQVKQVVVGKTGDELIIKGIIWGEQNPLVIINKQTLKEGDTISGTTVVKINKDSVVLERDGKNWTQSVQ